MSTNDPNIPIRLRRREAAKYLKDNFGEGSESGLAKLAVTGGGPLYYKYGAKIVTYLQSDLDAWAQGRLRQLRSTADA